MNATTSNQTDTKLKVLTCLMGRSQKAAVHRILHSEESEYAVEILHRIGNLFEHMPRVYDQDGAGDRAIAYLHYFTGSFDWYITERNVVDGQDMFGLISFGCEPELGYVSIPEITSCGAELDFHFAPCMLSEIKEKRGW